MAGFLDIDVLREAAPQMLSSDKSANLNSKHSYCRDVMVPNNEIVEEVVIAAQEESGKESQRFWRGLFCSNCTCLIQSPFFYECTKGCQ